MNDVVLQRAARARALTMILLLVRDRPAWAGVCGLLVLTRPSAQLVVVVAAWLVWRAAGGALLVSAR